MRKKIKISLIAEKLNLRFEGEDCEIEGLGLCNRCTNYSSILSYVTSDKYIEQVRNNKAITSLVVSEDLRDEYSVNAIGRTIAFIISDKPEMCFYLIHEAICSSGDLYERYDFDSMIGDGCNIAASVVIEKGVIIGNKVTIGPNSVIRSGSIIDDNARIGCNTTIGSEGFQLITDGDNLPMHVTHVGRCHICSNVFIGDNACVCNSLFEGETFIGEGTKIDNLVYIAHNIYIGRNVVITAHVTLCGSTRVEDGAWVAPNSSILNRVVIGKGAKVGMGSVVTRNVAPFTVVYGNPAKEHEKQ